MSTQMCEKCKSLEAQVKILSEDPSFGVLTSPALSMSLGSKSFPQHSAIYLDIDDMKQANSFYGLAEVDRKIKRALNVRSSDILIGRWHAGDELVAVVPRSDVTGFCDRLHDAFHRQGLSCTIAVVPVGPRGANAAVAEAEKLCSAAKNAGRKGVVVFLQEAM